MDSRSGPLRLVICDGDVGNISLDVVASDAH